MSWIYLYMFIFFLLKIVFAFKPTTSLCIVVYIPCTTWFRTQNYKNDLNLARTFFARWIEPVTDNHVRRSLRSRARPPYFGLSSSKFSHSKFIAWISLIQYHMHNCCMRGEKSQKRVPKNLLIFKHLIASPVAQ